MNSVPTVPESASSKLPQGDNSAQISIRETVDEMLLIMKTPSFVFSFSQTVVEWEPAAVSATRCWNGKLLPNYE